MKSKKQMSLAFFLATLVMFTFIASEPSSLNLIENPSFEFDDDLNAVPDCWYLVGNYPNNYYLDSQEKVFGDVSLKMETYCVPYRYTGAGGALVFLDAKPNTTYTVSYYVKTDHPDQVYFQPTAWESDINGNGIGQKYVYLPLAPGVLEWQRKAFTFTTSPNTARICLVVTLHTVYSETVENWKEGVFYTSWIDGVQLEENSFATPFEISFISCPQTFLATIDIDPNTLELKSEGEKITCYIEFPQGHDVANIDVSTVRMNETVYADLEPKIIGDHDGDLITDLTIKFNRQAVINYLISIGVKDGDLVELTVKGNLNDGTSFRGSDTIRVINGY